MGKYEGNFKNNKRHGRGIYTSYSGFIYDGEWDQNFMTGKATINYDNGDFYEGKVQDGKRHGYGKYTTNCGSIYDG